MSAKRIADVKAAVRDVLQDDAFWRDVEHTLNKELREGWCEIRFRRHGATVFVAGSNALDVVHDFSKPRLKFDDYGDVVRSTGHQPGPDQIEDIKEQIVGIDRFIKQLKRGRAELQRMVDDAGEP
jgi:hypothetical protein